MDKELVELAQISKAVGGDKLLTTAASGNVSAKTGDSKFMYIKASGSAIKDLTEKAATSGRQRRVFRFSKTMFKESQILNRPTHYALMRADYIDWELKKGMSTEKLENWINYNLYDLGVDNYFYNNLIYISTGPKEEEYIK